MRTKLEPGEVLAIGSTAAQHWYCSTEPAILLDRMQERPNLPAVALQRHCRMRSCSIGFLQAIHAANLHPPPRAGRPATGLQAPSAFGQAHGCNSSALLLDCQADDWEAIAALER